MGEREADGEGNEKGKEEMTANQDEDLTQVLIGRFNSGFYNYLQ